MTVRDEIRALHGYVAPPQEAKVKLNQNESPLDLPAEVREEILARIAGQGWNRYPESDAGSLRDAVASHAGWDREGVIVGNGSNELIQWVVTTTVPHASNVVIAAPTFSLYESQAVFRGAQPVPVLCVRERFDTQTLLEAVDAHEPAAVFVCSPNNPTGAVLAEDALRALCGRFDGVVIADEAYRDFAAQDFVDVLRDHANLVLLRTFSKAYGLAAVRVGYLLAAPGLVEQIDKVRLPYNLGVLASTAAATLLEHEALVAERVGQICSERERLIEALGACEGLTVIPSQANFLLCELDPPRRPARLIAALLDHGVLIRDVSGYPTLERCVRITIGSKTDNQALLDALPAALERAASDGDES